MHATPHPGAEGAVPSKGTVSPKCCSHRGAMGGKQHPWGQPPNRTPSENCWGCSFGCTRRGRGDGIGTRGFGRQAAVSSAAAVGHRAPAAPLTILHEGLGGPRSPHP